METRVYIGEFVFPADKVQQRIGKRVQDLQGELHETFRDHSASAVLDPVHKGSDDCIARMRLPPIGHALQFNKLFVLIINRMIMLFRLFCSLVSAFYKEHVFRREESYYRQLSGKVSTYETNYTILNQSKF